MIVIPSIDVEQGRVVKRVHGEPGTGERDLGAPARWARTWADAGARRLHLVDLDGASGSDGDRSWVDEIIRGVGVPVQFGGGIRSTVELAHRLDGGAERVVVSTRVWTDPEWADEIVRRFGERVAFALDVDGEALRIRGWSDRGPRLPDALELARSCGVHRLVFTDVTREGDKAGPDLNRLRALRRSFGGALQVAGGVGSRKDLMELCAEGIEAVIAGRALYDGSLSPQVVAEVFG